jgi:hypothetical protein
MNKPYALDGVQGILSYPFKAPGWQSKFVIGAALFFANYIIPIVPGIFITGYFAKVMRNSIVDQAEPALPEWDDWGTLFKRGFKISCAVTIYFLPVFVLMIAGYLIMNVSIFASSFSADGHYNNMTGVLIVGIIVGLLMLFLGFILYIPLGLMLPPAIAHLVAKDSFAAAFHVREWWAILRANLWGFFTAAAVILGTYTILFLFVYIFYFTVILCFLMPIGLSVIVMYLSVISAPLLGEAYRKGLENLTLKVG